MELSWYALRKQFRFDEQEIKSFAVLALAFAFILSFDQWGAESFDPAAGLKNLVIALVLVTASLLVHDTAHRLLAIRMGYASKLKVWWPGLAVVVLIALVTNGAVKLFVGATIFFTPVRRRLGSAEPLETPRHQAYLSLAGPVASLLFAGIIRAAGGLLSWNPVTTNALVYFNLVFGVLSFLPIPPLDGSRFIFHSRTAYAFALGTMLAYAASHILGIPSILIAVLGGIGAMLWWMVKVEGTAEVVE